MLTKTPRKAYRVSEITLNAAINPIESLERSSLVNRAPGRFLNSQVVCIRHALLWSSATMLSHPAGHGLTPALPCCAKSVAPPDIPSTPKHDERYAGSPTNWIVAFDRHDASLLRGWCSSPRAPIQSEPPGSVRSRLCHRHTPCRRIGTSLRLPSGSIRLCF